MTSQQRLTPVQTAAVWLIGVALAGTFVLVYAWLTQTDEGPLEHKMDCLLAQLEEHRVSNNGAHRADANFHHYLLGQQQPIPGLPETLSQACRAVLEP